MKNLGGAVILYQPNQDVINNICSYLDELSFLIIFDNSEIKEITIQEDIKKLSNKIIFIDNPINLGIAKCLNNAAEIAIDKKVEWLLTMDQDSHFEFGICSKYFERLVDACSIYPSLSILTLEHSNKTDHKSKPFDEVRSAITSGSIIKLEYWKKLGGFEEKLFIDEVDTEYVFKNLVAKLSVIRCNNLFLNHQLGTVIQTGYLRKVNKSNRIIHSPFRVYFMVRNYLYIQKKYAELLPLDIKLRKSNLLTSLKNNILFSGEFFFVLKNILKGYKDFLFDNYN